MRKQTVSVSVFDNLFMSEAYALNTYSTKSMGLWRGLPGFVGIWRNVIGKNFENEKHLKVGELRRWLKKNSFRKLSTMTGIRWLFEKYER